MSLFGIINQATTALLNTQTQIGTVSDNIANSNSPTYVARQTNLQEQDPSGGLDTVQITRAVNTALQQELLQQSGTASSQSFINNIYSQLEQLDGSSTGTPTLVSAMQNFTSAFQALQATPESTTSQQAVIEAGQGLVQAVQGIASGVQSMITQTQQQTQTDVNTLNTTLAQISSINNQIAAASGTGQSTASLQDSLDADLQTVAGLVPVQVTFANNGTAQLSTPQGTELVGTTAASFSYNAATNTIFAAGDPNQTALNGSFTGGKIGAELSALDTSAAGVASQNPADAPFQKVLNQLSGFVDQFWAPNPPGPPTAFQAAYNNASPTNTGEQGTDFFTISNFGATPNADFAGFQVNPALLNGTATVKQSSASPVVAQLTAATNSFNDGGVSVTGQTYTGIAAALASNQTQRAQQAQSSEQTSSAALTTTQTAYQNATGVNVNQELSQLIVLQNSFSASGKVISVVQQLFSTLEGAVGATSTG
jgi:flagellar hook-associated protein 1 FlgK